MGAAHDLEPSERAMRQPITCSSVLAMSTTTSRAMRIPSTNTTRWASPVAGGSGQTAQNSAHLRLNVRPPPGMSDCLSPDVGRGRNDDSRFAALSILLVKAAPQPRQRHLWDPAFVFPNLFVPPPQYGHLTLPMAPPRSDRSPTGTKMALLGEPTSGNDRKRQHVLSTLVVGAGQLGEPAHARRSGLISGNGNTFCPLTPN